jgi:mono/diheme cytochrome c family protein
MGDISYSRIYERTIVSFIITVVALYLRNDTMNLFLAKQRATQHRNTGTAPMMLICWTLACWMVVVTNACQKKDSGPKAANDGTPQLAVKEKPQYYKVKEVKVEPTIDATMEKQGNQIFDVTCTGCHKYDERYVGPALGKVTERRTPEFIMNMILDTETMIERDDTVRCLLQTYLMKMPNMQVNEKDARAVLEHLRAHAAKK